ncbi:hypothetical protein NQ318_020710 [Aromia moschata]|uniref:Uncharacterized protein n=1 Tax=Aromia moschata TaxID=1265417 RepID=A0AAV8YX49_9CUCU|nr:hypothetical protein NQ318_020710 [Aromia moschata]
MVLFIILVVLALSLVLTKLYVVLTHSICKSNVCLLGKTALVTGGNAGIGYEIVLNLASRGCRVIIADKEHDPNLGEKIFRETNSTNVVCKHVDLASFKSIRAFAKEIVDSEEKLNILVNNAGIGSSATVTEDGLGLLKKSSGRIIFTSSLLSHLNNLTLDNLRFGTDVSTYSNSKLCDIIAADMFSHKLKEFNVTSNSYHPWIVATTIFKTSRGQIKTLSMLSFWILVLEYMSLLVGRAYDKKFCEAIWKASEELVKLEPHEKI